MDLNSLEGLGSLMNNLTGGAGISGLGDLGKFAGLLGKKDFEKSFSKFPLLLILILIILFGNKGAVQGFNQPLLVCCCDDKKHHKHHKRKHCCCHDECECGCCGSFGNFGSIGSFGGCGGGGFGGCGNIIFIIIILLLIQFFKNPDRDKPKAANNIFSLSGEDNSNTEDYNYDYLDANEEE